MTANLKPASSNTGEPGSSQKPDQNDAPSRGNSKTFGDNIIEIMQSIEAGELFASLGDLKPGDMPPRQEVPDDEECPFPSSRASHSVRSEEEREHFRRLAEEAFRRRMESYEGKSLLEVISDIEVLMTDPISQNDMETIWEIFSNWDIERIEQECLDTVLRINAVLFTVSIIEIYRYYPQFCGNINQLAPYLDKLGAQAEAILKAVSSRVKNKRKQQIIEKGY